MTTSPLRLGISRCLLGDEVRFDGGHKQDHFLTEVLGPYVEWIPVCPEVEAGLGAPREAMRLVGNPNRPRLMTITSRHDHSQAMESMVDGRLDALRKLDISGFVFKRGSPSCGVKRVRVYTGQGIPNRSGVGIFAKAFIERFPLIPIEEEGRLCDPSLRENFIERVFCYRRFQDLVQNGVTRQALIRFHSIHKYLLLAHSRQHYEMMSRLLGQAPRYRLKELTLKYGGHFMKALLMRATVRKHVNVLQRIVSYFKNRLTTQDKDELLGVINDYHHGSMPLAVPLTLIKQHARKLDIGYIYDQIYLHPHPIELILQNLA